MDLGEEEKNWLRRLEDLTGAGAGAKEGELEESVVGEEEAAERRGIAGKETARERARGQEGKTGEGEAGRMKPGRASLNGGKKKCLKQETHHRRRRDGEFRREREQAEPEASELCSGLC